MHALKRTHIYCIWLHLFTSIKRSAALLLLVLLLLLLLLLLRLLLVVLIVLVHVMMMYVCFAFQVLVGVLIALVSVYCVILTVYVS